MSRIPAEATVKGVKCGSSSVDRALAFQAKGREFEPRLPLSEMRAMRLHPQGNEGCIARVVVNRT